MHLTREEEREYAGELGPGRQRAMELLVALGDIYGAERLVPISSAQVSGASFKTIGDAGISFLEDFCAEPGLKASVRASLNPLGLDLRRWRTMGVSDEFHRKQARIVKAYARLGIEPLYSCTPYLAGNRPRKGQHLAWAESSATVFANSFLGAYTNREGGPSALAAAIVGKTPEYGLHLEENRRAKVQVTIESVPEGLAPIAGYVVGKLAGKRIPHLVDLDMTEDEHKAFGAAMAATSAVSMYTFSSGRGRPPRSTPDIEERISLPLSELERTVDDLGGGDQWDLVAIGCPHCSPRELRTMAKALKGRRPRRDSEAWFCTSRSAYARCPKEVATLRRFGKVLCDTCMVVAPIEEMFQSTASDSGKAMVYLPTLGRQRASFRTREALLEAISR
jgi:predicted aconitase